MWGHLDAVNPQIAAKLLESCSMLFKLSAPYQAFMREAIESLLKQNHLSNNVLEIAEKCINA